MQDLGRKNLGNLVNLVKILVQDKKSYHPLILKILIQTIFGAAMPRCVLCAFVRNIITRWKQNDDELQEDSVVRNFRITAPDGKNYDTKHYNLSAIIAVGYKVNSERDFDRFIVLTSAEKQVRWCTLIDIIVNAG